MVEEQPVSAPYSFVPLSEHICFSEDLDLAMKGIPSQDAPISDGLSGRIDVALTCETPVLVSWAETEGRVKRFGTIGEVPFIPGSSLRGMVRNVLEIASFGRMSFVDNARTSLRDLTAVTDYRNHFTRTHSQNTYESKVYAGWLCIRDGQTILYPCEYARVDHFDTLNAISRYRDKGFRTRIEETDLDVTLAENVQAVFLQGQSSSLDCTLWVEDAPQDRKHSSGDLRYRKATAKSGAPLIGSSTQKPGTLVFTGIPGSKKQGKFSTRKHMEFFFFDKKDPEVVAPHVLRLFLDVHERQEKVSPTWTWRQRDFVAGKAIPVFFIRDETHTRKIRQIGLSMMFKMASDFSVHILISNTSKDHVLEGDDDRIDLATRLFGRVGAGSATKGRPEQSSFKTRVSFGWAEATPNTWRDGRQISVHLQKPKPGYFPSYVRQQDFANTQGDRLVTLVDKGEDDKNTYAAYRTYMDWTGKPNSHETIRGWKRYPVLNNRNAYRPAEGAEASVLVPLEAGPAGKPTFNGSVRYHNLHPIELGALVWALTWGGNTSLRHAIGMGKPLGWGQVAIAAQLSESQRQALNTFVAAMERWAAGKAIRGGWEASVQIRQLKAMANPTIGDRNRTRLKQMVLAPDSRVASEKNQFLAAKKQGYVLPEYDMTDVSLICDGPNIAHVKGMAELKDFQKRDAKDRVAKAMDDFKDSADRQRGDEEARAKAQAASLNADVLPPGSKVYVDDGGDVRIVLEKDGNNYRIVSKRADGTGRERVKITRMKPA